MSVGFMGLLVAVLAEHQVAAGKILLVPQFYRHRQRGGRHVADDLRLYAWVQFMPLLVMPVVLLLFDSPYTHRRLLLVALAIYAVAKLAEHYDRAVFAVTGEIISGHSLKHLLAALALFVAYGMLRRRTAIPSKLGSSPGVA